MSTRLRRMSQPQADREVTRKVNLFYSGLIEDLPGREVGDPGREGNHSLLKAVNVIPTMKTLKCRPTPFVPYCSTLLVLPVGEQAVIMDVNSYGEGICITNGGTIYYRFEEESQNNLNDGVSDNWIMLDPIKNLLRPITIEGLSALNMSLSSVNHRWYLDVKTVSRKGRYQFELGIGANGGANNPLGVEFSQISFDIADYDLYMKQRPQLVDVHGGPYSALAYRYDFLYTFCCLDVDGNIIRETGTFNMSSIDWTNGNKLGFEWDVYYSAQPFSNSNALLNDQKINLSNTETKAEFGVSHIGMISKPAGYTHLAVYRTMNKSNGTPDAQENAKADIRGGLLDFSFRLVDTLDLSITTNQRCMKSDIELATARILPTLQYKPIPYTTLSSIVNGTYFSADSEILYYSDLGATPESLGFCYYGIQQIDLEQSATAMCGMQNALVVAGRDTTWRFSTSNITYIKSTIDGRVLSQIQAFSTIEGNGIDPNNRNSMINWSNSAIIAFCSDRSIRVFDGNKWGDDVTFLKVSNKISKVEYSMMSFDSKGHILFHYVNQGSFLWNTLRMSLRSDVNGAFTEFNGSDWGVNWLCKTPVLNAGNPFMRKNSLIPFGGGALFWDSVLLKFRGYSENEDYFQWPCLAPCLVGVGTFTGENMSYWTTHQESHLYVDATYSTELTSGGIQAEISGLYAGNRSAVYDNANTISGNFLDGEDIIFTKNIGGYRGFNIDFTFPNGGYEIIGIDTKFRVIDRPVLVTQNLTQSNENLWNASLFSRFISRYSLQNTTQQLTAGILSGTYTTELDPLAEELEQKWAITPITTQLNVPHGGNSLVDRAVGVWFKTDGSHSDFTINIFGISYQIKSLALPSRTEIWQNGLLICAFLEVYANDSAWHYFAVHTKDSDTQGHVQFDAKIQSGITMNCTTGIEYSVLPINVTFFDFTVLNTFSNSSKWVEFSLNYFLNLRNYSRE